MNAKEMEATCLELQKYYEENASTEETTSETETTNTEDPRKAKEFEGKTDAQITKILKKRAEKEEKAKAKKKAKDAKKGGERK